ncbi:exported hypothetical protein [[Clostridium] ultunense Esp]|uniref:hypothetical protein n=1 Tax=Thermicanus aegyptius TaxID=94009 RepID=UPI0002B6F9AE|nr:hypothetical protein [Thermicanus aegyptius]CCQ95452.1 exported hypothetical protein [[Clostridium] ultunense Esp]
MSQKVKKIAGFLFALLLIAATAVIIGLQVSNASADRSEYADLPKEKREILERLEAKHQQFLNVKEKVDKEGRPAPKPPEPIKTEILDFVDDPLNKKEIDFVNGWVSETKGQMKGHFVGVGVGALTEDKVQGVVLIRIFKYSSGLLDTQQYLTPEKRGAVKVVDYEGLDLILEAEDGFKWKFNVPSGKFTEMTDQTKTF